MKKIVLLLFIALFIAKADSYAQFSRYIVRLKDKGTNPFSISNPIQYLTQRSIDRRTRYNIAIDSTDLPVTPRYIDSIRLAGAVIEGEDIGSKIEDCAFLDLPSSDLLE